MGTALFVFYKAHPQQMVPDMATDAILPLFIVQMMPAGIGGLVVAGIFAAAQSTLSSGLNSVATCVVTDFYRRLKPETSDRNSLALARGITVAVGIAVTMVACVMASINILSLWDSFLAILGLTGGALAGLFALGIFTTRANGPGALCGAVVSVVVLCLIQQFTTIHFFLYAAIGIVVCFGVGWIASWYIGGKPADLTGLVFTTEHES
jgi:Na+/proline symporter